MGKPKKVEKEVKEDKKEVKVNKSIDPASGKSLNVMGIEKQPKFGA